MDENLLSKLDSESLNDYNIYKEVIDLLAKNSLTEFDFKEGKIYSMYKDFFYSMENGQRKYFLNGSKIIYFTNKAKEIIQKPFFIHDQKSLDKALKITDIKNGILKYAKNYQENNVNKQCDSTDSKSSISSINNYEIEDILNSNFNLIKESDAIGVKYILNEKRFNDRFNFHFIYNLDFNFKYIKDNYIKNKIDYDVNQNNCLNKLYDLVLKNKSKSYCYIFGPRGTGKTTLLLKYLNFYSIPRLYFSLKIMSNNNRRLKKYALMETIYTFDDIPQMKKFSDINVNEISDSSNLLEFIFFYIKIIKGFYSGEKKKKKKIWVVIDDYNKDLYDKNNIIEKIITYINENKTKLFLCILGDGKYINEKFYEYYSNEITNYFAIYWNHSITNDISQKNKILTLPKYYYKYNDLKDLTNIETIIQENLKKTFKKMNLNSLLFLSKIINLSINIKNFKDELINLPLEYLTIERNLDEDNNILLNFSFNTEIYKIVFNSTINGLLKIECLKTKTIIFNGENHVKNGIDFEDLIIEQLWNNSFDFLFFPDNNKLIVEEIFNLKYNKNEIRNDLNIEKPIIIRQKLFKGKYYDLLLILNINNKIYAIFIQIGLSKKGYEINKYLKYLMKNEKNYKEDIKNLINHNIDKIGFLLIFDYNHQKTLLEKNNKSDGVGFCDENEIDFLIYKDFNLFKNVYDKDPIKSFDVTEKTLINNYINDNDNEITNEIIDIKNNSEPLYPLNEIEKSLIFNYIKNDYDELIFLFSIKNFNEKENFISNKLEQLNVFNDDNNKYFCYNNEIFKITNNQLKKIKNRKEKNYNLDIYFLNKKTKRKSDLDN
jgi:hypothetical protein